MSYNELFDLDTTASSNDCTITFGFPGSSNASASERLANRRLLTVEAAERAGFLLCAAFTGLKADEEIFQGNWGLHKGDVWAFRIEGEKSDSSPDFRSFKCSFTGRTTDRTGGLRILSSLYSRLPAEWATVSAPELENKVVISKLCCTDKSGFKNLSENGRSAHLFDIELFLRICTTPSR